MAAYDDIFLPKELERALEKILVNVHRHYRDEKSTKLFSEEDCEKEIEKCEEKFEKPLKQIYSPILEGPILKDEIIWFNAWHRRHTGQPMLYHLKDKDKIHKRVIGVFRSDEYHTYVTSLSALAKDYKFEVNGKYKVPLDYSFLITTESIPQCEIGLSAEYVHDFFVYINLNVPKMLNAISLDEDDILSLHNKIMSVSKSKQEQETINFLAATYALLEKNISKLPIDEITRVLSDAWSNEIPDLKSKTLNDLISEKKIWKVTNQTKERIALTIDDHRKNILRLINYYFWIKLAYPKGWKVILYLPGVVAKGYENIPMGINIGLKDMVPLKLNVLLFLKRAVLMFFTREAVDYFEERARRETAKHGLRSAVAAIAARNFAHHFGSHILARIKTEYLNPNNLDNLGMALSYISERSEFIANLTSQLPISWGHQTLQYSGVYCCDRGEKPKGIIELYQNSLIKEVLEKLAITKFCKIEFNVDKDLQDKIIGLPYGPYVGKHAIYSMIENYIRNIQKYDVCVNEDKLTISLESMNDDQTDSYFKVRLTSNATLNQKNSHAKLIKSKMEIPFIESDGSTNQDAWGFKEMRMSAFLLANKSFDSLEDIKETEKIFKFCDDEAKKSGRYSFEFILRKYKLIHKIADIEEFNRLKIALKGKSEVAPVIGFLVLENDSFLNEVYKKDWDMFPIRVAVKSSQRKSSNWLESKMIYFEDNLDEEALYKKLMEKWIQNLNIKKYKSIYFTGLSSLNVSSINDDCGKGDMCFCHDGGECEPNEELECVNFTHGGNILVKIKQLNETDKNPGIEEEWKLIAGSKILLIDDRLKIVNDKFNRFNKFGLLVLPEENTTFVLDKDRIYVKNNDIWEDISSFNFMSIHLGYLDSHKDCLLLNENYLNHFPSYIFVHTGRGKVLEEIKDRDWIRKVLSLHNLIPAVNCSLELEAKIILLNIFCGS